MNPLLVPILTLALGLHQPATTPTEAFNNADYQRAADLWQEQADRDQTNFVPHYNLAVTHTILSQQTQDPDHLDRAAAHLVRAIELGFTNLDRIQAHPALDPLRDTETYQRLHRAWPEILTARRDATLEAWRAQLGPRYRYTTLDEHRAIAITAPTLTTTDQLETNLDLTHTLATRILGDIPADDRTPWVFVLVLTPADYAAWLASDKEIEDPRQAVALAQRIAGQYDHDTKRLVARDADATLRHEFFHALHHRHADRLALPHPPPWILEGLACLAEHLDENARPLPTDRLDIVRRRARANRLTPIETLAEMDLATFESSSPLANYAECYAIWLYLAERDQAATAYQGYAENHTNDTTGLVALEQATDRPPEQLDLDRRTQHTP